ncbi:hypothetical protein [Tahibacter harae]|uniref:Uncharacterized protein n=1 Tax=Tahibacter harae TaxID=2963937 RepID=A0ABT1QQZ8_9GAMM|nr:hypothetical protein [Tahibacter harae]MCQ4164704.1 hypothetical protein [Tahibacter harae]
MLTLKDTTYVWNNAGLQSALKASPDGEGIEIVSDFRAAPAAVQAAMLQQSHAEGVKEGERQAAHDAALAERKRIRDISAVAPGGWRDPAAKLAIAAGISVEEFAYKLTMDAIAGGKPLPAPNSSHIH